MEKEKHKKLIENIQRMNDAMDHSIPTYEEIEERKSKNMKNIRNYSLLSAGLLVAAASTVGWVLHEENIRNWFYDNPDQTTLSELSINCMAPYRSQLESCKQYENSSDAEKQRKNLECIMEKNNDFESCRRKVTEAGFVRYKQALKNPPHTKGNYENKFK